MAYPRKLRAWWLRVMPKCQALVWNGLTFELCGEPTQHIHHIVPEKWSVYRLKQSPHEVLALGLCKRHHVGLGRGKFGSDDFSMHPDYGYALDKWRENPNLLTEVSNRHIEYSKNGIVYWNNEGDGTYLELAHRRVEKHKQTKPEDVKPPPE